VRARSIAGRTSRERVARSEPFEVFTRPQRSQLARVAGLVVRLRAELTTAAVAVTVWLWLVARMAVEMAGLLVGLVLLAVAAWPVSRRYVVRRGYAVMTRHRIRATFVERRIMNYSGNVPVLLWARPIPAGERVWLLLRAGIDAHDIERILSYLGSACWGGDARLHPCGPMAALVTVDVIRRDPLAADIASPLGRRLHLVDAPPALPAGGGRSA
jgi:hypothetical protein